VKEAVFAYVNHAWVHSWNPFKTKHSSQIHPNICCKKVIVLTK